MAVRLQGDFEDLSELKEKRLWVKLSWVRRDSHTACR